MTPDSIQHLTCINDGQQKDRDADSIIAGESVFVIDNVTHSNMENPSPRNIEGNKKMINKIAVLCSIVVYFRC